MIVPLDKNRIRNSVKSAGSYHFDPPNQSQQELETLQAKLSFSDKSKQLSVLSRDNPMEDILYKDPTDQEMKAFKLITWQPEGFSDLTILYQPARRKPNI